MEKLKTEHGVFTNNVENGQSAQEVYEEWLLRELKPTFQELRDAELEIKILMMLSELEVV